jgi:hypothetical protein
MDVVKRYWTKAINAGSFVSATKLYKVLSRDGYKISIEQIKTFLNNQFTHQLHKPIRKRFPRRPIIVSGPNLLWDVDLLDLKQYTNKNFRNRYIITVIDVFSRKAYGEAMTNKTAKTAARAFEKIIKLVKPQAIRTDHGNEFKGAFNTLLKIHSIKHILTSSPEIKANYVERFHRTFRDKLAKHMTYYSNQNWTRVYKKIIESYNSTPHTSLLKNMCPNDVGPENVGDLLSKMLKKCKSSKKRVVFKVGQLVRITSLKKSFAKASKETYTDELFKIKSVSQSNPVIYKLVDLMDEPIVGAFYEQELQLAETDSINHKRIAKTINKGKNVYKVHFKNWPTKFDTQLTQKEIKFYEQPK